MYRTVRFALVSLGLMLGFSGLLSACGEDSSDESGAQVEVFSSELRAQLCSPAAPNGPCSVGLRCIGGACVNATAPCSSTVRNGFCASGLQCIGGACASAPCSPAVPNGVCSTGLQCIGGACVNATAPCSPAVPYGFCAVGQCINGVCI
jgi:hypothetical protein